MYDAVTPSWLYNRLVWGNAPSDYSDYSDFAVAGLESVGLVSELRVQGGGAYVTASRATPEA